MVFPSHISAGWPLDERPKMDRDEIVDAVMQPIADAEIRSATGDGWWLTVVGWQGRARHKTRDETTIRVSKNYAVGLEMACPGGVYHWAPEIPSARRIAKPRPSKCELAHNRSLLFPKWRGAGPPSFSSPSRIRHQRPQSASACGCLMQAR